MRALMVGGGCRGLQLARALVAEGHAVRAVTRTESRRAELEAAGCECWIGDPDRIGTLRYALDNVTVLLWLLGTATGPNMADVHGSRLRMMLDKVTDTTVRGVLYEAAGSVDAEILETGAAEVARAQALNEIPGAVLEADPSDPEVWVAAAREAIEHLLTTDRASIHSTYGKTL
jgi:NAD(P)H-binding